jgi:hypothetical protein
MTKAIIKNLYRYFVNNFELMTRLDLWRSRNKYPYKVLNKSTDGTGPTIHFLHRYVTNNTGDKACGYYQYFHDQFKDYDCLIHDINNVKFSLIKSKDIVIIGGGGLLNATVGWNYSINKAASIAKGAIIWSAGFNARYGSNSSSSINWSKFDLIAVRDFSYDKFRYVPCATCVMPGLEKSYPSNREIGVIAHKDVLDHLPLEVGTFDQITNSATIEEFIEFIGSSEVIITNSYHAAYWSTLMKKKCVLFAPRSEKYNYYKYPPALYSGDLSHDISQAKIYPNALRESKNLTLEYFEDIKQLILQKTETVI